MKKQTKKLLSLVLVALMLAASVFVLASCGEEKNYVYVTVADGNGKFAVAYEKVEITEMTVDAALRAAHAEFYSGGEDGYASAQTQYGLSLTKLWGTETSSCGYYVNNVSASSLADAVENGNHVYAFIYTDMTNFSDSYSYFNVNNFEVELKYSDSSTTTLNLTHLAFDENWNLVKSPVAGAVITLNGEKTDFVTDENGNVNIIFSEKGEFVISAVSEDMTLVPPVAVATVK